MISKEQFLELKHLKSLGVPTTKIAKKLGISVPSANKWLRLDEEAFNTHLINNTPYLEQYRAFILSDSHERVHYYASVFVCDNTIEPRHRSFPPFDTSPIAWYNTVDPPAGGRRNRKPGERICTLGN